LSNLGYNIARSTIAEILERHGIEPAPERCRKKTTWKEFYKNSIDGIRKISANLAHPQAIRR
jgi:hypothetical protein